MLGRYRETDTAAGTVAKGNRSRQSQTLYEVHTLGRGHLGIMHLVAVTTPGTLLGCSKVENTSKVEKISRNSRKQSARVDGKAQKHLWKKVVVIYSKNREKKRGLSRTRGERPSNSRMKGGAKICASVFQNY